MAFYYTYQSSTHNLPNSTTPSLNSLQFTSFQTQNPSYPLPNQILNASYCTYQPPPPPPTPPPPNYSHSLHFNPYSYQQSPTPFHYFTQNTYLNSSAQSNTTHLTTSYSNPLPYSQNTYVTSHPHHYSTPSTIPNQLDLNLPTASLPISNPSFFSFPASSQHQINKTHRHQFHGDLYTAPPQPSPPNHHVTSQHLSPQTSTQPFSAITTSVSLPYTSYPEPEHEEIRSKDEADGNDPLQPQHANPTQDSEVHTRSYRCGDVLVSSGIRNNGFPTEGITDLVKEVPVMMSALQMLEERTVTKGEKRNVSFPVNCDEELELNISDNEMWNPETEIANVSSPLLPVETNTPSQEKIASKRFSQDVFAEIATQEDAENEDDDLCQYDVKFRIERLSIMVVSQLPASRSPQAVEVFHAPLSTSNFPNKFDVVKRDFGVTPGTLGYDLLLSVLVEGNKLQLVENLCKGSVLIKLRNRLLRIEEKDYVTNYSLLLLPKSRSITRTYSVVADTLTLLSEGCSIFVEKQDVHMSVAWNSNQSTGTFTSNSGYGLLFEYKCITRSFNGKKLGDELRDSATKVFDRGRCDNVTYVDLIGRKVLKDGKEEEDVYWHIGTHCNSHIPYSNQGKRLKMEYRQYLISWHTEHPELSERYNTLGNHKECTSLMEQGKSTLDIMTKIDFSGLSHFYWISSQYHKVVETLLATNSALCFAQEKGCRNPMYFAAIKGKITTLKLFEKRPNMAREKTNIVHKAVKKLGVPKGFKLFKDADDETFILYWLGKTLYWKIGNCVFVWTYMIIWIQAWVKSPWPPPRDALQAILRAASTTDHRTLRTRFL